MERLPVIKAPLYAPSLEDVANGNQSTVYKIY